MKQLSEKSILVVAIFVLSMVVVLQIVRVNRLKSQLKSQTETTEYAINALEKCSGHRSEISGKVVSLREQLKTIPK